MKCAAYTSAALGGGANTELWIPLIFSCINSPPINALALASNGLVSGERPYFLPFLPSIVSHVSLINWNNPEADEPFAFAFGSKPDSAYAIFCIIPSGAPVAADASCNTEAILPGGDGIFAAVVSVGAGDVFDVSAPDGVAEVLAAIGTWVPPGVDGFWDLIAFSLKYLSSKAFLCSDLAAFHSLLYAS